MKKTEKAFENDQVDGWTPPRFAIAFTRKMRKHKGIAYVPSIRSSLAIPKFLTARYFRTHILTPNDYLEAAILNTAYEDQAIAEIVARSILFPKHAEKTKKKEPTKQPSQINEATEQAVEDELDPMAAILGGLADLQIDFDDLDDLNSFESVLEQDDDQDIFELFERMYSSVDQEERSLAELMVTFGGAAEFHAWGANDKASVEKCVQEMFRGKMGELSSQQTYHGSRSFLAKHLCQEAQQPWELASALAGQTTTREQHLQPHLDDLLENSSTRELGKTIQFLQPHLSTSKDYYDPFVEKAFEKVEDLSGFSELLTGLGEWIQPSQALIQHSAENIQRALTAAHWINKQFGQDVSAQLFEEWVKISGPHTLPDLAEVAVDCKQWTSMTNKTYKDYVKQLRTALSKPQIKQHTSLAPNDTTGIDPALRDTSNLANKLFSTGIKQGKKLAQDLMTESLCLVCEATHFLPLLDEFLAHGILPADIQPIVQAAISLGINPNEVYDRIGNAREQLRQMINNDVRYASRYKRLAEKITDLEYEQMLKMAKQCFGDDNLEGMAALLAINMGEASQCLMSSGKNTPDAEAFIASSLCYKGIGGGTNLLKQWFTHKDSLNASLKERIKVLAKDALLDVALEWMNKGSGSAEGGLIPQNQARPYLSGDDLDLLDIENTLDAIISSGKSLDAITEEDLYVHDTSKGRAAFSVLIDISGSMSGDDLAICAIAVVMLLGRVKADEIALAVFESDTHVIKSFTDDTDLDHVADQVLDLEATGGTCVDAALRWANEEFENVPEAEFKMLFLLTDFGFSEEAHDISQLLDMLTENHISYLGAAHGYTHKQYEKLFLEKMGGQSIQLKNMKELPSILIETLEQIGEDN